MVDGGSYRSGYGETFLGFAGKLFRRRQSARDGGGQRQQVAVRRWWWLGREREMRHDCDGIPKRPTMYLNLWRHKVVMHMHSNPMIQPEPKGSTHRYPLVSIEVLRTLKDGGKVLIFKDYLVLAILTKKVDKTPCGLWYGKVPNLSFLKVLGCKVLVKWDTPDKLQQRSVKCIFIGYPKETMGYYFYFPPENKIVVARYVEFLKKNILSQEVSGRVEELEEIQDKDTSPSKNTNKIHVKVKGSEPPQEKVIPIHRSARTYQAPGRLCLKVKVKEHS
nr:zinc finger, CCHC-type [Tanacetum cinerariifolium]